MYSLLHIDWLSLTIPIDDTRTLQKIGDIKLWQDLLGEYFTLDGSTWRVSAPMYGYTSAYISSHGTQCMFGQASMGIHIIYSGQALQALVSKGIDTKRLIDNAITRNGKATRVDIALDIIDGTANVDIFHKQLRGGKAVTASKTWRTMAGSEGGHTLYIGSRSSERMVRIYDKKAERAARFEEVQNASWVRVEAELKGDRARDFLNACKDNDIIDVMRGHLVGAVDFPSLPEYQQALQCDNSSVEPTTTKRKDTQTRHWLMKMVAPVIAREAMQDTAFYATLLTEINTLIERGLDKKDT